MALLFQALLCTACLMAGTADNVLYKLAFQQEATGLPQYPPHKFTKPLFQAELVFIAMTLNLLWVAGEHLLDKRRRRPYMYLQDESAPATFDKHAKDRLRWSKCAVNTLLVLLSLNRVLGINLLAWSMNALPVSLWSCLRCSSIVFTAAFSKLLLPRQTARLSRRRWLGVFVSLLGTGCVVAQILLTDGSGGGGSQSRTDTIVGLIMVLLSSLLDALSYMGEERLMKEAHLTPAWINGIQGVICVVVMTVFLVAAQYIHVSGFFGGGIGGVLENTADTFAMMRNDHTIITYMVTASIAVGIYTGTSEAVGLHLSSVHRALVSSMRIVTVFVVELILFATSHGTQGEAWTRYSFLQVIALLLLSLGAVLYTDGTPLGRNPSKWCRDYSDNDFFDSALLLAPETDRFFYNSNASNPLE